MSGDELGLGSALSEEEGAVSPPSLFVLLLGHKKEHNLEGKNIYCAGCFGGTGSFDVGGFQSLSIYNTVNFPKNVYFAGWKFHIGTIKCNNGTFDAMVKV